jgi:ribonuclease Z
VLTHFSQRYGDDVSLFRDEAAAVFDDVVTAEDLERIPMPRRR